jgi:hypothetical protein
VVATSAVFGVAGALAVGAVLARPREQPDSDGTYECPTAFSFMPGTTWEEIASVGMKSIDEIRALNPSLTDELLATRFNEVKVGVRENAQCAEAIGTIPAAGPSTGGTPEAKP